MIIMPRTIVQRLSVGNLWGDSVNKRLFFKSVYEMQFLSLSNYILTHKRNDTKFDIIKFQNSYIIDLRRIKICCMSSCKPVANFEPYQTTRCAVTSILSICMCNPIKSLSTICMGKSPGVLYRTCRQTKEKHIHLKIKCEAECRG